MSTAFTTGYTDLLGLITGMLSNPGSILLTTLEWGDYIMSYFSHFPHLRVVVIILRALPNPGTYKVT